MNVHLAPVDAGNWRKVIALELADDQKHLVAANVASIAQSKVEPWWETVAIYAQEQPVGFVMFGFVPQENDYWIARLMIDRSQQRKGYGRAAMEQLLAELQERPDCPRVRISCRQENIAAAELYLSLGFEDLEKVEDGERLFLWSFA